MSTEQGKTLKKRNIDEDLSEFRKNASKTNEKQYLLVKLLKKIPKWMYSMMLGLIMVSAVSFFTSSLVVYFYDVQPSVRPLFGTNNAPGKSCSSTSECVIYAYCSKQGSSTVGACTCSTNYYYDSSVSTTQCTAKGTYASACTSSSQCMESIGLKCNGATCNCDTTTQFWNTSASECQYLIPVLGLCNITLTNTCADASSSCTAIGSSYRCLCNTGYIFNPNTGKCTLRFQQGVQCSTTSDCISYSYCGIASGDTTAKCWCDSFYTYYSSACNLRLGKGAACTISSTVFNDQCNLAYYNLRCISSVCNCESIYEYWDPYYQYCMPLKKYSQTCTQDSDCITTNGMVCLLPDYGTVAYTSTRKICRCISTQYYDEVARKCLNLKAYHETCSHRRECANNDFVQCTVWGSGTTKRCTCMANLAYDTGTACVKKVARLSACATLDGYCYDYAGFACVSSVCACPSTHFWDTNSLACQWRGRPGDYCNANSQCQSGSCGGAVNRCLAPSGGYCDANNQCSSNSCTVASKTCA